MDLESAKERLVDEVDRRADVLVDASHQIHAHPELAFEEVFAHDLLTDLLEADGLEPERGAYDLDTAFAARAGEEGPTIAVMCEYDALPGIGHACGHNIIAAAGLGAGLAAASLADELGGRVVILGTPAEEGGGGKVLMMERGALDGVDAAMMVHPAGADLRAMNAIAIQQILVSLRGRGRPRRRRPAQGSQRARRRGARLQQRRRAAPAHPTGRARPRRVHRRRRQAEHRPRPRRGALVRPRRQPRHPRGPQGAGAAVPPGRGRRRRVRDDVRPGRTPSTPTCATTGRSIDLYAANMARFGRTPLVPADGAAVVGSTDMGNVSYSVPSMHPMIAVAPPHVAIHTAGVRDLRRLARGDQAVVDGAKAMAMTIADLWMRPDALDHVRAAFAPDAVMIAATPPPRPPSRVFGDRGAPKSPMGSRSGTVRRSNDGTSYAPEP